MKNDSNDPWIAMYESLKKNRLFRYDLLSTVEACWIAILGEVGHGTHCGEYLDSLVRHVVDYIGPRQTHQHWLAIGYNPAEVPDLGRLHDEAPVQFHLGDVSWVHENELRGTACPPECLIAIQHHKTADGLFALVPRR